MSNKIDMPYICPKWTSANIYDRNLIRPKNDDEEIWLPMFAYKWCTPDFFGDLPTSNDAPEMVGKPIMDPKSKERNQLTQTKARQKGHWFKSINPYTSGRFT